MMKNTMSRFQSLGDLMTINTGEQLNRSTLSPDGQYPVYNGGVSHSGFHSAWNTEGNTLIVSQGGASAGFVNFLEVNFWAGAHCYVLKPKREDVLPRFMYFVLKSLEHEIQASKLGAGIPGLNRKALAGLRVPLPSIDVQLSVVRQLDSFTQLEAELEAELEARRKQYEHYRNQLLTFAPDQGGGVRWLTLGEVGSIHSGLKAKSKADFVDGGAPFMTYMDVFSDLAKHGAGSGRVLMGIDEKQFKIKSGDILFTGSSESPEEIGTTSVVLEEPNEDTYLNSFCFALRPNPDVDLNPRYARHVLRAERVRKQIVACGQGVTRVNISKAALVKVRVPVPHLDKQNQIVEVLDAFDALVNDISIGLPAEIAARRKQYEYYRNQLLSFDEVPA